MDNRFATAVFEELLGVRLCVPVLIFSSSCFDLGLAGLLVRPVSRGCFGDLRGSGRSRDALDVKAELALEPAGRCPPLCLDEPDDDATDVREDVLPSLCESWSIARMASTQDAFDSDVSDS